MRLYRIREDVDISCLGEDASWDMRWTEEQVRSDAENFETTPEEFIEMFLEPVTYWLKRREGNRMTLYTTGDNKEVYNGLLSDAGITKNNDPEYIDKLDAFFERKLGISAEDWYLGL